MNYQSSHNSSEIMCLLLKSVVLNAFEIHMSMKSKFFNRIKYDFLSAVENILTNPLNSLMFLEQNIFTSHMKRLTKEKEIK